MAADFIFVDNTPALAAQVNANFAKTIDKDDVKKSQNNFVIPATSNTSFTSNVNNNPYGFFFDDGKARYGCERIHFMGLVDIKEGGNMPMFDSAGLRGYHPIDALNGKVRYDIGLYGAWYVQTESVTDGFKIQTDAIGDYIVYTGILNKFNVLSFINLSTVRNTNNSIYLDGVDTTNKLNQQGSDIIASRNYETNQIQNCLLSTTQGIHTVKIINGTDASSIKRLALFGIEIVNEANSSTHELCIPASNQIIKGKTVVVAGFVGASALALKGSTNNGGSTITGTKGGFVGYYVDENGLYISKVQEPVGTIQSGNARWNAGSSDTIDGLSDSTKFYANTQGNIIRVKDAGLNSMLLVPTGAPAGTSITVANDYDGSADTTLFQGNKQFQGDATTGSTIADGVAVTVELYAKIGANADHTNEELYTVKAWEKAKGKIIDRGRTLHALELGRQSATDFTMLGATSFDAVFTASDGRTHLVAEDPVVATGALSLTGDADFYYLVFYGTGLDIETLSDGMQKICSDLPLGFHTFKVTYNSAGTHTFWSIDGVRIKDNVSSTIYKILNFFIYRPKKPALTDNYEYSLLNYVLADYVKTSLPTNNLATYTDMCIDQGVVRVTNAIEFVYTGSGTWTYNPVNTGRPSGRALSLAASNDGNVKICLFGSGQFRWWLQHDSNSDTITISKDGSALETAQALGNTNMNGRAVAADTIGSECLCTLDVERVTNTNNVFYQMGLDYHTPVFNQFYNLANPFPDYLMGQCGVLDNRKLTAFDSKPDKRLMICETSIAIATAIPTTFLLLCSMCCDYLSEAYSSLTAYKADANVHNIRNIITIDGAGVEEGISSAGGTGYMAQPEQLKELFITKRARIAFNTYTGWAGSYTLAQAASTNRPAYMKIEEK